MDAISFNDLPNAVHRLFEKLLSIERLLLANNTASTSEADEILTIQQASELLKLSVPTIYGLVSKAGIPVSKPGKRLYFSKKELIAWVKAGRKITLIELGEVAEKYSNRKRK